MRAWLHKLFLLRAPVVAIVFAALATGAAVQRVWLGPSVEGGHVYTHYNNYVVFRASFTHLIHNQDLYALFPSDHWDLFKYSPTFALLMGPFAILPDSLGVVLWALTGSALLFIGIWRLPLADERSRMAMAWLLALPMLQSAQNSQSNAHVAGLVLLSAVFLESALAPWAALAIALGFFVKIYGVLVIALVLLYPIRWKATAWTAMWMIALGLLPLVAVSPTQLWFLYGSWGRLLSSDQAASTGVSP